MAFYYGEDLVIIGVILVLLFIFGAIWLYSKSRKMSKFFKKILDFLQDLRWW